MDKERVKLKSFMIPDEMKKNQNTLFWPMLGFYFLLVTFVKDTNQGNATVVNGLVNLFIASVLFFLLPQLILNSLIFSTVVKRVRGWEEKLNGAQEIGFVMMVFTSLISILIILYQIGGAVFLLIVGVILIPVMLPNVKR